MIKGIDASAWQGVIDFNKVKNTEYEFVIFRDGIGLNTDTHYIENATNAQKNGVRIPGIYHFSHATNVEEVKREAQVAIGNAKKLNLPKTTIIFFDYEYESNDYYKKAHNGASIDTKTICEFAQAFCDAVSAAGYEYGIYANTDYYTNFYAKQIPVGARFWFCDLYGKADYPCDYHQYSWKGSVDGVNGEVDLNYEINRVEETVNEPKTEEPKPVIKSTEELANEVLAGKWSNGEERVKKLTEAGYDYRTVQNRVNELVKAKETPKKTVDELAKEVIAGKWGNGDERKAALESSGYNYRLVQDKVNEILKPTTKAVSPAKSRDNSIAGSYVVTAACLNCRYIPGLLTTDNVIQVLKNGDKVENYGYYTQVGNSKWYLIKKGAITGFVDSKFIKRV